MQQGREEKVVMGVIAALICIMSALTGSCRLEFHSYMWPVGSRCVGEKVAK